MLDVSRISVFAIDCDSNLVPTKLYIPEGLSIKTYIFVHVCLEKKFVDKGNGLESRPNAYNFEGQMICKARGR